MRNLLFLFILETDDLLAASPIRMISLGSDRKSGGSFKKTLLNGNLGALPDGSTVTGNSLSETKENLIV